MIYLNMIFNKLAGAFRKFISKFFNAVAYTTGIVMVLILFIMFFESLNPELLYKNEKFQYSVVDKIIKKGASWSINSVGDMPVVSPMNLRQIAVLQVDGTIMPNCDGDYICPDRFGKFISYVKNNKNIKGLVILLNSPGGEVYASEKIYQDLKELSSKKPVYIYAQSEIASGAYYISMGASKIFASPVSVLGSIGVYWEVYNYDGLLNKLGIKHKYLVSKNAKYKVESNWLFDNSEDSKYVKKALQSIVDDTEKVFIKRVKDARPHANLSVLKGLVVSADKAKQLGLIDGIYENEKELYFDMFKNLKLDKSVYIVEYYYKASYSAASFAKKALKFVSVANFATKYYLVFK